MKLNKVKHVSIPLGPFSSSLLFEFFLPPNTVENKKSFKNSILIVQVINSLLKRIMMEQLCCCYKHRVYDAKLAIIVDNRSLRSLSMLKFCVLLTFCTSYLSLAFTTIITCHQFVCLGNSITIEYTNWYQHKSHGLSEQLWLWISHDSLTNFPKIIMSRLLKEINTSTEPVFLVFVS